MSYVLHLLVYFNIYVIIALSLNLVVGYCGLLSLAHPAFYAVGGYAYATFALTNGVGFLPAAVAGSALAAALSLAVSLFSWRLRGDFFVLGSLAFQSLIFTVLNNWVSAAPLGSWSNITNGPLGIVGIPRPALLGMTLLGDGALTIFATATGITCAFVLWRLTHSPWGRLLVAMRDDDLAARGIGKNTRFARVQAFAISAGIAAVAGAIYAAHVQYLDPSSASLDESILMLSFIIVGGLGNFWGPVAGAAILLLFPELLRLLSLPAAAAGNIRLGTYGLLLVLFMHFRPQGVAGTYRLE